jgi:protease-4
MRFAKAVWKLLVGIKDGLVLIFMLLFFATLYGALSARPAPIHNGVLDLDLSGAVVEQPSRPGLGSLAGTPSVREHRLRDLISALDAARTDDRVKAVALDLERFTGGGHTAMADLAEAVRRVRASGKPVVAYANDYTDSSYEVASAASEIWLDPLGAVALAGPGGENLYYKGLLDKLGVTANVYRVGTYKAAVEPFIRNDMSPEAKQNAQDLASAMLASWRASILRNRPQAKIDPYLNDPVAALNSAAGDFGKAALASGLIDKIGDREAFQARLAELGGADKNSPYGYNRIPIASYENAQSDGNNGGSIGVITIAGDIVDGKAPPGTAGGDSISDLIDKAVAGGSLKALVVRIDSPGGSVTASERIRESLLNAKAHKIPIVVSMGSVAASGGYWVSTPGDYVFAEPSTITGSIGVFGILPSFQGTLAKLGLGADGVKTTPLSGEPDLLKGPSPVAGQLMQAGVNAIYARFLGIVAQARHKTPQQIDAIAQGRVWDGGTAQKLGLIDGFGSLHDAIAKAAELAKISNPDDEVRYLERPVSLQEKIVELLSNNQTSDDTSGDSDGFAALAPDNLFADALAEVQSILKGPKIQARCLECPPVAPAQPQARSSVGTLAVLEAWLR